jgi:glutathione S-transferase
MHLIAIVIAIALLEYYYITFQVGSGRAKYGVPAPAISGDPTFERLYRVQMNTVEQLVVFLPAIVFFGYYVSAPVGAGVGLVFVLGRALYFISYVKDPEKRTTGFLLTFLANMVLVVGGLIGAALQAF